MVRNTSSTSYQPQLPVVHAPSLFQPYRPPSPPSPEDNGQFSPPPLPIPPPRGPEDSPPPPIETRTSEIIPTRSQTDSHPQSYVDTIPEVQTEMFHLPTQASAPPQVASAPPPRATQTWQPGKADGGTVPTVTSGGSGGITPGDAGSSKPAFSQADDVQTIHQEIMRSTSVLPSQSSAPPTRPRPKVTIEDVPEDSPVLSKGISTSVPTITPTVPASRPVQQSQHTTVANANSTSKPTVVDQPIQKSSPQSRSKEPLVYRTIEPSSMPIAPPMPPPTPAAAPTPTRFPSSAPPTQPTFPSSSQAPPVQRATSHTVSSRTYQRAAEMLQASKLSAFAGTNPGAPGSVNKSTAAPVQSPSYNAVNATAGQHQPANGASVRPVNATATAPHPGTSATASMSKVVTPTTTTGSGPPVSAPGLHTSAPSTAQPSSASRSGPLSIPSVDATPTTIMSTAAVKNTHQEQPVVDSTRPRDVTSSATRNLPSSSHIYPTSARQGTFSAMTQQTHVTPAQPPTHYHAVSMPTPSSSAVQKPPSPRKYSQPISSTTVSTQPFPSRPSASESQSTRVPISGHLSTPAPIRSARLTPPDHTNDPDMLKTPSSIAPSPMLNPDTSNSVPQSIAVPIRARQVSTDSKDDKKKGLFGLFRTRTLSSKAVDPPPVSSATRVSLDQGRAQPDASVAASTTTPVPRGTTSTSAPKESHSVPPVAYASTRTGTQFKGRIPDPFTIPPPPTQAAREHRDATPHMFTPFKFLHSKRNRTVSAASLDVCDGNTAVSILFPFLDARLIISVDRLIL